MIIHFVAYPNSKDFLLLQAFYKLFGIPWYEADIADQTDLVVSEEEQLGGYRSAEMPWRFFYDKHNSTKSSLIFARTRRLPEDKLPFVYVSRNPASIFSEAAQNRMPDAPLSQDALVPEILGIGEQPDWSSYYRVWKEHGKEVSASHFVRTEDFCADPLRTLIKIAVRLFLPKPASLGDYACPLPADNLASFNEVDSAIKNLFFALHGTTMQELGYSVPAAQAGDEELVNVPSSLLANALNMLRAECNASKQKAVGIQAMQSYITSLENQHERDTASLLSRINKLKESETHNSGNSSTD